MKFKTIFLLLLLIFLLAVGFWAGRSQESLRQKLYQHKQYLFADLPIEKIDWLQVGKGEEKKIFVKVNGQWQEKEASSAANQEAIDKALKTVKELKREQLVSNNPDKKSIFAVDDSGLQVILKVKDVPVAHLYIGKRGQDFLSNFYRKEGEDNVYLNSGLLDQIFTAPLAPQ